MLIQQQLIQCVIAKCAGNETEAAKAAGIGYKSFNAYKHERCVAGDDAIIAMAEFAGLNVQETLARHRIEHAPNERVKRFWTQILADAKEIAKAACLTLALMTLPQYAHAAQAEQPARYALCEVSAKRILVESSRYGRPDHFQARSPYREVAPLMQFGWEFQP